MQTFGTELCNALAMRGCRTVFGIPGVHNQELYRGLAASGLDHILARHEQGAGFMADGYARATGRPGIVFAITGPGLANAATPIGQAYSDSVPMLVITTCHDDNTHWQARLHEVRDQHRLGSAVADWCETARDADHAFALMDRAFAEFASMRKRPKVIQLPLSLLAAKTAGAPAPSPLPSPDLPEKTQVEGTAWLLERARRPLFIFGSGAASAAEAARSLVDRSGAAVFEAILGRGIVPGSHPMNFGAFLRRPESAEIVAKADLVIAVGAALSEIEIHANGLGHKAPMIKIDHDGDAHIATKDGDTAIVCDPATFLKLLNDAVGSNGGSDWRQEEVEAGRARLRDSCEEGRKGCLEAAEAIGSILDSDSLVFSDMTQLAYVAEEAISAEQPGRWHHPLGFGTLGYALPAAIGAKIGAAERNVIALAGDYGIQYTIQELAVAVERNLALSVIIWDNGKLQEIEDSMLRDGIEPAATRARNPDFATLALAYGATHSDAHNAEELRSTLLASFKKNGPSLIQVHAENFGSMSS